MQALLVIRWHDPMVQASLHLTATHTIKAVYTCAVIFIGGWWYDICHAATSVPGTLVDLMLCSYADGVN